MAFAKGHKKLGGRKKGAPNQTSAALKEMILEALAGAGGVAYLQRQANESPAAFMALLGKVLPLQVTGEGGGPVLIVTGVPRGEDK
jgi:hypothetical protein